MINKTLTVSLLALLITAGTGNSAFAETESKSTTSKRLNLKINVATSKVGKNNIDNNHKGAQARGTGLDRDLIRRVSISESKPSN